MHDRIWKLSYKNIKYCLIAAKPTVRLSPVRKDKHCNQTKVMKCIRTVYSMSRGKVICDTLIVLSSVFCFVKRVIRIDNSFV